VTIVDLVIRLLAAGAAVVLLYVGLCVYEDQEKALQSRIEDWWIELDDLRRSMTTRHAEFANIISRRANGVLEHVFRGTLFSKNSVATARRSALTDRLNLQSSTAGHPSISAAAYRQKERASWCLQRGPAFRSWQGTMSSREGIPFSHRTEKKPAEAGFHHMTDDQ